MHKNLLFVLMLSSFFSGCASVPMVGEENSKSPKEFRPPSEGNSGLYIYRSGLFGGSLKKDVWIDGKCIGETAPSVFFYEEVEGNKEHKISTESEFSPNDLALKTKNGALYFIRQYIKMGVLVGGADVELVVEAEGKKAVEKLKMAKKGNCSK